MSIQWRLMRPRDIRECVEIAAASPVLGPRYGSAIRRLGGAWLHFLGGAGFPPPVVFEETHESYVRLLGCGVSAFASDDFMRELKTPPFRWFGVELIERVQRLDGSLLSEREVAEANSSGGLNLVVWDACLGVGDLKRPEVLNALMSAFIENHRGFFLKGLIAQCDSAENMQQMMESGGRLLSSKGGLLREISKRRAASLEREPHVVVMDRELASEQPGSWVASLFVSDTPKFGFRRSEQKLLLAALRGGTDEELSDELGVSRSAVKKTWRSIYERVAARNSNLIPEMSAREESGAERGKAKKHRLLNHLRAHPEELRPVSRSLLSQPGVKKRVRVSAD